MNCISPRWGEGESHEGKLGKPNYSCSIYKFWLFVNWLDYGFIWHFCGTDYYMLSFLIRIWSIFWSWIIMKMVKVWETEPHKWLMVPRLIVISEDNCHVRGICSGIKIPVFNLEDKKSKEMMHFAILLTLFFNHLNWNLSKLSWTDLRSKVVR